MSMTWPVHTVFISTTQKNDTVDIYVVKPSVAYVMLKLHTVMEMTVILEMATSSLNILDKNTTFLGSPEEKG